MRLVPVKFHSTHAAILQSNERRAFQFTPPAIAVTLNKAAEIVNPTAESNDLDGRDLANNVEAFGVVRHHSNITAGATIPPCVSGGCGRYPSSLRQPSPRQLLRSRPSYARRSHATTRSRSPSLRIKVMLGRVSPNASRATRRSGKRSLRSTKHPP